MTDTELENGFMLSLKNAQRLIEEADGLAIFERFSRAYTLYQLGIEEIGKCLIIYNALLDYYNGESIDAPYLKKHGFFEHKDKTQESLKLELLVIDFFEKHIGRETGFKQKIIDDFNNVNQINNNKNNSLYVSIKDNTFCFPDNVITIEMVNEIALLAKIRLEAIKPFQRPLTEIETIARGVKELIDKQE